MSRAKYTTEQGQAIAAKLREMPAVEKEQYLSKQGLVRLLAEEIKALQDRGYSLEQIRESLRGEGLSITMPTLKNYLQRAKPVKKAPAKKAPAKKPGDTPAAARVQRQAHTSPVTFTPIPDSDDI